MADLYEKITSKLFGSKDDLNYDDEDDIYGDDADLDYPDDDYDDEPEPERSYSRKSSRSSNSYSSSSSSSARSKRPIIKRNNNGKVIELHSNNGQNVEYEIMTQRPKNTDDAGKIMDVLMDGKPVLVNYEGIMEDERQRIMDMMTGCLYSLQGTYCKASLFVVLYAPGNIDITGDLVNDYEASSLGFNDRSRGNNW